MNNPGKHKPQVLPAHICTQEVVGEEGTSHVNRNQPLSS